MTPLKTEFPAFIFFKYEQEKLIPELEMVGLLSTGLDGRFYEKETEREARLIQTIKTVGKKDPEEFTKDKIAEELF